METIINADCHDDESQLRVPNYESDSSSSEKEIVVDKKKKVLVEWILVNKYDNCNEAEMAVKAEDTWSVHFHHATEEGKKKYYRCNKLKRTGPQCSARIYLLFDSTSDCVFMFRSKSNHDHDEKNDWASSYGLSDSVKTEIDKLLKSKMKPKAIMQNLTKIENIKVPTISQLGTYLNDRRRRGLNDEPTISLKELKTWILLHAEIPADPNEVFVISYSIDDCSRDSSSFCFVLSTKYLIEISKDANVIHADATYKIIWQGFLVLVCGTTDQDQKFHPLCLTVANNEQKEHIKLMFEGIKRKVHELFQITWNPKVLVCDTAKTIHNAFLEVFDKDVTVRICWTHAKKKMQKKVESLKNKQLHKYILEDIETLHSITCPQIFEVGSEAFLQKYKDVTEFVAYFKEQWLVQNRNWFLGAAPNSPSTNNSLEQFIKTIKDSNTLRERFPLSRFLEVVNEIIREWSTKYTTNPEDNYVAKVPSISLKDWTDAYQWAREQNEVNVLRRDDHYSYYEIAADEATTSCEIFEEQGNIFSNFIKQQCSKWLVVLPIEETDWRKGKCYCAEFFKKFKCKHVIGLAIRLKYIIPPTEAQTVSIGQKRRRGRPPKPKDF